jgi:spore coat polysaccharide biosynthesis protein SpsF
MTGVFLQVRIDSRRLPRKALIPLGDQTVIEHAMDSLAQIEASVHALLTDRRSAPIVRPLARSHGFETFVGAKDDVLARFTAAIGHFGVQTVVRATGDNPLVSSQLAEMIIAEHHDSHADYSGYDGPPLGTGVEILDSEALLQAADRATESYHREHVSPYLYHNPGIYHIHRVEAPQRFCLPEARVTLDTEADLRVLSAIFADLYRGAPIEILELLSWLRSNPQHLDCRNSA